MSYLTDLKEKSEQRKIKNKKLINEGKKGLIMMAFGAFLFYLFTENKEKKIIANEALDSLETQSKQIEVNRPKVVDYELSAMMLYDIYDDNVVNADMKFKGKVLQIDGYVNQIMKDREGNPVVEVFGTQLHGRICCWMNREYEAASLSKGDHVKLIGICNGQKEGIICLEDCEKK